MKKIVTILLKMAGRYSGQADLPEYMPSLYPNPAKKSGNNMNHEKVTFYSYN
jgi:hypothetical protein